MSTNRRVASPTSSEARVQLTDVCESERSPSTRRPLRTRHADRRLIGIADAPIVTMMSVSALAVAVESLGADLDCNANGVADAIEIARGTVIDEDLDGVPDVCQTDGCTMAHAWRDGVGIVNPTGWSVADGSVVNGLIGFDLGEGPMVVASARFLHGGNGSECRVARWSGISWSPVGEDGPDGPIFAMAVLDLGDGPELFVAGQFTSAGGVVAANIAKFDGETWSAVGTGLDGKVDELAVFDDGRGPALYAGGGFSTAGGISASGIARWDGVEWSAVGSGVDGWVYGLAEFDDGTGSALYASGSFEHAGGEPASRVARWDGSTWSSLGSGMDATVFTLAVFDDGKGAQLHAAGRFTVAGGVSANRIARWDGLAWSPMGDGMNNRVRVLEVFDDGSGPRLHAGGWFTEADGVTASRIARWDGTHWSPLDGGVNANVEAMLAFNDGAGPSLYVGGVFGSAGGSAAAKVAKWACGDCRILRIRPEVQPISVLGASFDLEIVNSGSECPWNAVPHPCGYGYMDACCYLCDGEIVEGCCGYGSTVLPLNIDQYKGYYENWVDVTSEVGIARVLHIVTVQECEGSTVTLGSGGSSVVPRGGGEVHVHYHANSGCYYCKEFCEPVVSSTEDWITIAGATHQGNYSGHYDGQVSIAVDPHPGSLNRAGCVTIELGDSFACYLVMQSGDESAVDLNLDGLVDGADLSLLLLHWGGIGAADLNLDGIVDGEDLGILLIRWGEVFDA